MAIIIVSWVCTSVALCLAFLSVAARPAPHAGVQMVAGSKGAFTLDRDIRLQNVNAASPMGEAVIPAPSHTA